MLLAFADDDVARGTGAAPAARVLEVKTQVECDVEQGSFEAVLGLGHGLDVHVPSLAFVDQSHFRHSFILPCYTFEECSTP